MGTGDRPRALVWTRSLKDYAADAPLLAAAAAGAPVIHLPCVSLTAQPVAPRRQAYDYAVVTSANAAQFAWDEPRLRRALTGARAVFTHGPSTAAALRQRGLAPTLAPGARTAEELCAWLGRTLPAGASVALPTAAEPAFDLAGGLRALGYDAEALVCYATAAEARDHAGRDLTSAARADLVQTLAGVVCFASPSAVAGFAAVLAPAANRLGEALTAVVIGPTTATAARPQFAQVRTAAVTSVAGLVGAAVAVL